MIRWLTILRTMLAVTAACAVVLAGGLSDAISPEWRFNAGLAAGVAYMAVIRALLD